MRVTLGDWATNGNEWRAVLSGLVMSFRQCSAFVCVE